MPPWFACAVLPDRGPAFECALLATVGNSAIADHLQNFCSHVKKIGVAFIVGAVDTAAYGALAAAQTPVYKTPLAFESYAMDGSNSHSSRSWLRFASMRTGEVMKLVLLGYDALHTDTDIVWLRDPTPYLMCTDAARAGDFADATRFPCAPLATADVAVSSDNMGPSRAVEGGAAYHAGGTFNSGILLFRSTPEGRRFVTDWHTNVASPPRGSRFVGKTSDQQGAPEAGAPRATRHAAQPPRAYTATRASGSSVGSASALLACFHGSLPGYTCMHARTASAPPALRSRVPCSPSP